MRVPEALRYYAASMTVSSTPMLDAQLIIGHCLGCSRAQVLAMDHVLTAKQQEDMAVAIQRRQAGEPLAYILGQKDFYATTLLVDKRVLVPRPETELLVDKVVELPLPADAYILDVGTGSGAIAISMAQVHPGWRIVASDIMPAALDVAQKNIQQHQLQDRIVCCQADIYAGIPTGERFAVVVSNPPYIEQNDPHLAALRHEPQSALVSPEAGLYHLQAIIAGASTVLCPHGYLAIEHGYQQKAVVHAYLRESGYIDMITYRDLGGLDRVTIARLP